MGLSVAGTALTALSALGTANTIRTQRENAKIQASIAEGEKKIAENKASIKRRQGYDSMTQKKLETASELGAERAKQGASGGVMGYGSNGDVLDDIHKRGESEALLEYQKGLDSAYSDEASAWNATARKVKSQSEAHSKQTSTLLGGISSLTRKWDSGDISLE